MSGFGHCLNVSFQNGSHLRWTDNSVYAFEAWHTRAPYLTPFSLLIEDRIGHLSNVLINSTWLEFQPTLDASSNCTAIWAINSMILQWISLPCEQVKARASYICEFKNNTVANFNHSRTLYSRVLQREILECPANTTYINSLCVRARTVKSSSIAIKTMPKLCGEESKPFHLTGLLDNGWQENNKHFRETLRLFYLRWPSLYDYEFIDDDWLDERVIVGIDKHGVTEAVEIVFSKSTKFNMRLLSINKSSSAVDMSLLDIVCGVEPTLANTMCITGHFRCTDGTCILEHYLCDGHADCPDLSDEADCSHVCSLYDALSLKGKDCHRSCTPGNCMCHQLYFQCQYGGCVPWSRVCDGKNECSQGEDELFCSFYQDNFTSNVVIIQKTGAPVRGIVSSFQDDSLSGKGDQSWYENGNFFAASRPLYEDFVLSGGSLYYFNETHLCTHQEETTCLKNFLGECFPRHRHCVFEPFSMGTQGCRDGAHLRSCYLHSCPNFFKCHNDYCLPFHLICNGVPDCPNGEDEEECERMSCLGFLLCSSEQICVHSHDLWTGRTICYRSQDDQALVGARNCPDQCECLGQAVMCNNIANFSDFQTSKYTRLIIMEGTTVAQNTFRWADVTSEFLMVLVVSRCNLTSDNTNQLIGTVFLKRLNLSNNMIAQLDSKLFSNMKSLESLDISRNLLHFLAFDVFKGAEGLKEFVASYNRISEVHCGFSNSKAHLERLILNNNHMESLHSVVACHSTFRNLLEMNVSYNRFHKGNYHSLFGALSTLYILDATPLSLCCFLVDIAHCHPASTVKNTLCKSLMPSNFLQGFYWAMGIFLVLNTSICIGYLLFQLCKKKNKLPLWLTIFLLLSHWILGFYFSGLAIADNLFSPYYSSYEQLWRSNVMCVIFDVLSLASFLQSLFASALLSVLQMISVRMPFRVSGMQSNPFYVAIGLWVGGTLVAGALGSLIGSSRDGLQGAVESGVCLNLLWPGNPRFRWVAGTLLVPGLLTLTGFVCNQLVIICTVGKSGSGIALAQKSQVRRSRVRSRAFCCLLVQVLGSLPVLISYILTMSGIVMSDLVLLYFAIGVLVVSPVVNPFLHVYSSSAFIGEVTSRQNQRNPQTPPFN